jgi:hypothetical protein
VKYEDWANEMVGPYTLQAEWATVKDLPRAFEAGAQLPLSLLLCLFNAVESNNQEDIRQAMSDSKSYLKARNAV